MVQGNKLRVFRGLQKTFSFSTVEGAAETAKDITGWSVVLSVVDNYTDRNVLFTRTGTVTSGTQGAFSVILTTSYTTLTANRYIYQMKLTDTSSNDSAFNGDFIVEDWV